jgi:hypothetical protein
MLELGLGSLASGECIELVCRIAHARVLKLIPLHVIQRLDIAHTYAHRISFAKIAFESPSGIAIKFHCPCWAREHTHTATNAKIFFDQYSTRFIIPIYCPLGTDCHAWRIFAVLADDGQIELVIRGHIYDMKTGIVKVV